LIDFAQGIQAALDVLLEIFQFVVSDLGLQGVGQAQLGKHQIFWCKIAREYC
jgi:hypothetical protein